MRQCAPGYPVGRIERTSAACYTLVMKKAAFALWCACALHRVDPAPSPTGVPTEFAGTAGAERSPDRWWETFGDPALNAFVADVHAKNFQLAAAWARLAQARAGARQLGHLLPELSASASVGRDKTRFAVAGQTFDNEATTYRGSIAAAYEVDVWKRLGSAQRAATTEALALQDDAIAIGMTLASESVDAWLDARTARAKLRVVGEQLGSQRAALTLLEGRFRAGLVASILDIYQQRALVVQLEAQVSANQLALEAALSRLAVLVASTPALVLPRVETVAAELPTLPTLPAVGVPSDLLLRRPDVRAARRRVVAADHRVAAAVADRLPSLRLSATASLQSQSLTDLIAAPLWSLLAAATAPLWDNGRRSAVVDQNRAVVRERLAGLGQALTVAIVEVESALRAETTQQQLVQQLDLALALSRDTTREARTRYLSGQVDYLQVLTALQNEQRAELSQLDAQRQWLGLRVRLLRALGGTWQQEVRP